MRADDYLDLDAELTEEDRAVRDTVRDFARAELRPAGGRLVRPRHAALATSAGSSASSACSACT